ncbi:VWA domain-containing protein [Rapidithrix thailandica]|uniref:VWA domain-containing protein n=1 Tax=Rapidithrix thailandica TaxID=413964 RepID=A0AAW9SAQ5_9BACT
MIKVLTEYSSWYFLLCLMAGFLYAYLLYTSKAPWSKPVNYFLGTVRFILVTCVCFLLLGPYVKTIKNYFEKPVITFLIDDSQSIALVNDSTRLLQLRGELETLAESLEEEEYEVDIQTLNANQNLSGIQDIGFGGASTNISSRLKDIEAQYENRNLGGVVLVTDGIYNQGIAPNYLPYLMKVFAVGIGDTLPQEDINLKAAYANKIAYLGNKFPIVAEIGNMGFENQKSEVLLRKEGKIIERKTLTFTRENSLQTIEFLPKSEKEGLQHYVVEVLPLEGEFTKKNNIKNVYIDIIDSKEKILMVALSPHPDIKALRSAVEKNENYEFIVHIPGMDGTRNAEPVNLDEKYDLVIFHQIPNVQRVGQNLIQHFQEQKTAMWFILGNQSNLSAFNTISEAVQVHANGRQFDKVTPSYNNVFSKFTMDNDKRLVISKYPPVTVPFGNFDLTGTSEVVMFQKIGNITTDKPLLVLNEHNGFKSAVTLGEGIWQWRLHEYSVNDNTNAFDEIINKTVQYLSTKEDKRRFRVYPISNEFFDTESVIFETEVYNEIYERIYGQKIDLQITNEANETSSYTYTNSGPGFQYKVNGLSQGVYRYQATTQLNGKTEVSAGEFTVRELEIEAINTTADFNLLRNLAAHTNGQFYQANELKQLQTDLTQNKLKDLIHSQEEYEDLSNLKWLLIALALLASFEWFLRKFKGGY